ncbi:MAG: 3-methyl-2-oxobutanoate hydroxymethyltransferase [Anaerovoracaceae bacterium]|jgi:3-methyl-2-oxobutanoate hydroxymethyltransferase
MKNTVTTFIKAKKEKEKLTMLTAYDFAMARIMDEAGINSILVGDSVGNAVLGYKDTLAVTMEDMIHHGKAVARGITNALLIIDMPFMSYQSSVYDAVVNAGRLVKETGANAVKLEGGSNLCPQIKAIVEASIPVVGHLGLTPQSINALGGYKAQGRDEETAERLIKDAIAVEAAGAFAVVLECVPFKLAKLITEILEIPTIGIGAGPHCDGQVLVYQDMLGIFSGFTPKFVKKYADVGKIMKDAFAAYSAEVKEGIFPTEEHGYIMSDELIEKLKRR